MSALARLGQTAAHARRTPPWQLARGVEMVARGRLERWRAVPRVQAGLAAPAGQAPAFVPPPKGRYTPLPGGAAVNLPWGRWEAVPPVAWNAPATSAAAMFGRDSLQHMDYLAVVADDDLAPLLGDWIDANPKGQAGSRAWRPFDLSMRVAAWARVLLERGHRLPEAVRAAVASSLAAQTVYLGRHLERHLGGNHLIKNLKGLILAGAALEAPATARLAARAKRLLSHELERQILADGCQAERGAGYHCQVMADLLDVRACLEPDEPLASRLDATLPLLARAAALFAHPDGGPMLFNDGGLHATWTPAELLDAYAALTGRPRPAPRGPFALPDAGYWGLAAPGELLLFDCGPLGEDYLVGHGHGDLLSLEWSTGGRRVIVDPGTFQYEAGPRRQASRSSTTHNTVMLGAAEQHAFHGTFRCGRRARPELRSWEASGDGFAIEASHDGFAPLEGAPRPVRRLAAAPGRLAFTDRVENRGRHQASVGWLLHPEVTVEPAAGGARLRAGPLHIRVESGAPLRAEPAEWYPDLYCVVPTLRLVAELPAGELATSFTRLSPA